MTPEIIFIVDHFDKDGVFQTVEDRLRSISLNWRDNLYTECKQSWMNVVGGKIKFQSYNSITNFDPNKRYFYLCPIRNYENDLQKYFGIMDPDQLKRFADNNVGLIFSQDLEMIPNFDWQFFIKNLEWLFTVRGYNGFSKLKIILSFASKMIPEQESFIRHYFNDSIRFIYSPLIIEYFKLFHLPGMPLLNDVLPKYFSTAKEKQFLCLNKEPRLSRILFLHGLRSENLLDQGYVSLRKPLMYPGDVVTHNSLYAQRIKQDMLHSLNEMRADEVDLIPGDNIIIGQTLPDHLMSKSSYDLVSETTTRYELNPVVDFATISEKTLKSLYYGRPFMVNGGPNTLALLKELGFNTYDYIFDESYDNKANIIERHEVIINNIKNYHNRSNDIFELVKNHRASLLHNHNHLMNFDQEAYWLKTLKSI